MSRDPLWRIRLKYEHSRGRCDLCGHQGIVGVEIKLVPSSEEMPSPREEQGLAFMLRCADPIPCQQRQAH